jgi:hypothetical protein
MEKAFEKTLSVESWFRTYSLSLIMLNKSVRLIQERGADKQAVRQILAGIQLLNKQLFDAAEQLKRRKEVDRFITSLQDEWSDEETPPESASE